MDRLNERDDSALGFYIDEFSSLHKGYPFPAISVKVTDVDRGSHD
jgi:hypothetical protein